jgi:hypothetical protein
MVMRDISELLEDDPLVAHEAIMQATRSPMPTSPMPVIVHKKYVGNRPSSATNDSRKVSRRHDTPPENGDSQSLFFSDEQIDALAQVLAQTRTELRMDFQNMLDDATGLLRERVAALEGQLSMMTSLIANDKSKSFVEASEKNSAKDTRAMIGTQDELWAFLGGRQAGAHLQ